MKDFDFVNLVERWEVMFCLISCIVYRVGTTSMLIDEPC